VTNSFVFSRACVRHVWRTRLQLVRLVFVTCDELFLDVFFLFVTCDELVCFLSCLCSSRVTNSFVSSSFATCQVCVRYCDELVCNLSSLFSSHMTNSFVTSGVCVRYCDELVLVRVRFCDKLVLVRVRFFLINQNKTKNIAFLVSFEFSSLAPVVILEKLYISQNKRLRLDSS